MRRKKIGKNAAIQDVVTRYPESVPVFEEHGLGCVGCRAALFETIEEGAKIHGINVEALLKDLNNVVP
ncbi:MAG TPA: DUF1858 domain-containing protein [Syntrophorhabdaceae bacterium]|jgi:hybrid cluster-associated redox disulfide protein